MPRVWRTLCLLAVGCGRVGFEPVGDGSRGDAPVLACPAFAVLCDDFESGDLAKWTTTAITPGGTVVVDAVEAHSGTLALDATMPVTTDGAISAACSEQPRQSTGMLALRQWIYSPMQSPTNYDGVMMFADLPSCTSSASSRYAAVGCSDNNVWDTADNSVAGLFDYNGPPCVAPDTWECLELDYTFDAPPRVQLYIDDVLVIDHATADPSPAFAQVFTGIARADMAGYRVIVDDVIVAHRHIGCR